PMQLWPAPWSTDIQPPMAAKITIAPAVRFIMLSPSGVLSPFAIGRSRLYSTLCRCELSSNPEELAYVAFSIPSLASPSYFRRLGVSANRCSGTTRRIRQGQEGGPGCANSRAQGGCEGDRSYQEGRRTA